MVERRSLMLDEVSASDGDHQPAKKGRRKIVIIIAAVVLLIGGGGGVFVSGALDGLLGVAEESAADWEHGGGQDAGGGDAQHGTSETHGAADASHGGDDDGQDAHSEGGHGGAVAATSTYYDLPELIVNLNTGDRRQRFLRLKTRLEIDNPATTSKVEAILPRIVDSFQVFLRELRPVDLSGSAGTYRVREALLQRVNTEVAPAAVVDVLFVEMIVQ